MSKIRSSETKPERKLRSLLHRNGYRFRKNVRNLPGTPDIVLPKYKTVIFVNGCFWHQHPGCSKAVKPKSNKTYWEKKFKRVALKDKESILQLKQLGWDVITVWECEIKANLDLLCLRIRKIRVKSEG